MNSRVRFPRNLYFDLSLQPAGQASHRPMRRFLSFRLDTANQCLWHGEAPADLTPKAFGVLRYLVEHAGRLVTPDEILEALWPGIYINPEGLRRHIQEIREVLGDRPNKPVFIKTLLKRGYQFIAPVIEQSTAKPFDLSSEGAKKIVGREPALDELDRCLGTAVRGQRQIVFVTGARHRKNHAGRRIPTTRCR